MICVRNAISSISFQHSTSEYFLLNTFGRLPQCDVRVHACANPDISRLDSVEFAFDLSENYMKIFKQSHPVEHDGIDQILFSFVLCSLRADAESGVCAMHNVHHGRLVALCVNK